MRLQSTSDDPGLQDLFSSRIGVDLPRALVLLNENFPNCVAAHLFQTGIEGAAALFLFG
jgi:hypothetical protein